MVLRLVSGPMLEKRNKIGPLADRQKVLLTAKLGISLFHGFPIFREFREISGIPKSFGITEIRKISESIRGKYFSSLIILAIFLIFSILF